MKNDEKYRMALLSMLVLAVVGFISPAFRADHGESETVADSARLKKAMQAFRLEPGLRIELVAAEPLVVDPVAFAFDEKKRMYVVENRGYPDPAEGGSPTQEGRVALLEDRDGDGKYEHRSEFANGLTYPNGLQIWKGGVFVTCAPDIYFLKDTDGDGVADVKQVVLTGFNADRTGQIRVSHPTLGLDGKVYVTSGLNNGKVYSPLFPDREAVSFSAADGRFNPDTYQFETTGGRSQFGLAFDSYGRRFGCSNRHPLQHAVLEPWHLRRNSQLSFTETIQNVSKVEAEAVVFPISGAVTTAEFIPKLIGLSHSGTFTSACGILMFNGTGLTPQHRGNVFVCEPAQNLVQRQVVKTSGVSFQSELLYKDREFLSSTDEWFRPVFLQHGPDGALYIADMHRKVIDHPSYIPEEARANLDFESGKSDGRIYRIVRDDVKTAVTGSPKFNFPGSVAQIAGALASSEEWERQTAHRLLQERHDLSVVSVLQRQVAEAPLPETRVRALWLLNTLKSLPEHLIETAIGDKEAGVREQAVILAGDLVKTQPGLIITLVKGAHDVDARVRFTAVLALGSIEDPSAVLAMADVAAKDGADRWVRAAVLSGISGRLAPFMTSFRQQTKADPKAYAAVMQELGQLLGSGGSVAECRTLVREMVDAPKMEAWQIATTLGVVEGISKQGNVKNEGKGILYALLGNGLSKPEIQKADHFIARVATFARNPKVSIQSRINSVALLGYTAFDQSQNTLRQLVGSHQAVEIQLAAIDALARLDDRRSGELLAEKNAWSGYTPRVKSAVLTSLVGRAVYINVLLDAIGKGIVLAGEVPSMERQRLMKHQDGNVRKAAIGLFKDLESDGRMSVYQNYRSVLSMNAEPKTGKMIFERVCSSCHTYAGHGGKVGPDLTGVRNQPPDALLLHILVPNYEVLPAYQAVAVETSDGRSLSGWLMAETENSLTLKTAFGSTESVLRKQIKSLSNPGLSLMPDGLENSMTKEEMASLIAFLKSGG